MIFCERNSRTISPRVATSTPRIAHRPFSSSTDIPNRRLRIVDRMAPRSPKKGKDPKKGTRKKGTPAANRTKRKNTIRSISKISHVLNAGRKVTRSLIALRKTRTTIRQYRANRAKEQVEHGLTNEKYRESIQELKKIIRAT